MQKRLLIKRLYTLLLIFAVSQMAFYLHQTQHHNFHEEQECSICQLNLAVKDSLSADYDETELVICDELIEQIDPVLVIISTRISTILLRGPPSLAA